MPRFPAYRWQPSAVAARRSAQKDAERSARTHTLLLASLAVPEEGLSLGSESVRLLWIGIYQLGRRLVTVVYESTDPEVRYRVRKKPRICRALEG